jgi:homoaconitate hydratase family protein
MHSVEKIMLRSSNKKDVNPGEIIEAKIDIIMIHDRGADLILNAYNELNIGVHDPDSIVMVFDHSCPPLDKPSALKLQMLREFAKEHGIKAVYDIGEGICHVLMPDKGHVWPGAMMIGSDSHTTTSGALGALSVGVGKSEAGVAMATGELWLRVPELINFEIQGKLPDNVMARDVAQYILGKYGTMVAQNKVVEFSGTTVQNIDMDGRFCLCALAAEMGAMSAYIEPDSITNEYLQMVSGKTFPLNQTDPDYQYLREYELDVSMLEPQVACPHSPGNVQPISKVEGVNIDQASIGTCTGGRLGELKIAAKILKGKKIHPNVRMQIIPGSRDIYRKASREGLIDIFIDAGAIVGVPSCSNCGVIYRAKNETSIHTGPRNFKGRGGHKDSLSYNASPAIVAASAIKGHISKVTDS